jgi:hypothetical protein
MEASAACFRGGRPRPERRARGCRAQDQFGTGIQLSPKGPFGYRLGRVKEDFVFGIFGRSESARRVLEGRWAGALPAARPARPVPCDVPRLVRVRRCQVSPSLLVAQGVGGACVAKVLHWGARSACRHLLSYARGGCRGKRSVGGRVSAGACLADWNTGRATCTGCAVHASRYKGTRSAGCAAGRDPEQVMLDPDFYEDVLDNANRVRALPGSVPARTCLARTCLFGRARVGISVGASLAQVLKASWRVVQCSVTTPGPADIFEVVLRTLLRGTSAHFDASRGRAATADKQSARGRVRGSARRRARDRPAAG